MPNRPIIIVSKNAWSLLRETGTEWWSDNVSRLSAALAYYTLFTVAPLLVIGVKVAGMVFGQKRSQAEAGTRLEQLLGSNAAGALQGMLNKAAAAHSTGTWSAIVSGVLLIYLAGTLFMELQSAMNTIWEVQPGPDMSWKQTILNRLWPFLMVLAIGLVLLASLALGPLLGHFALGKYTPAWAHRIVRIVISLIVFTIIFGTIYKVLPDVEISWGDVGVGAGVTAVLFTIGELTLQWYLSRPGLLNVYGTAGSVAVLLLWVYYSAQVMFFGAEFTQVYARKFGRALRPSRGAIHVPRFNARAAKQA